MFKIVGGLVIYGFAFYGLGHFLQRIEREHPHQDEAERRARQA